MMNCQADLQFLSNSGKKTPTTNKARGHRPLGRW